ncbi:hypothetical protein EAH79_13180 [Sphingomonas koreensis]|nr:hypothetical protein EAH79_13180 [Sphingomonas koreensis]
MTVLRKIFLLTASLGLFAAASPASAQFYFKTRDLTATPVVGSEPGMIPPMPGATPDELTAGLVWTMRSGLNLAALQCQFEPTLLTVSNYNAMLRDHTKELAAAMATLDAYFKRVNKTTKAGQAAFDHFNEVVSSDFSTVAAQFSFCQTAASVGRDVLYAPPGGLGQIAHARMREMRASLVPWGEQMFAGSVAVYNVRVPRLDKDCWKKDSWNARKCGADPYGTAVASR